MHQNIYDHEKSEQNYRRYISNIAYRFKFEVIYDEECIIKKENGEIVVIVSSEEFSRNTLCYRAWMKLQKEYDFSGI